jgi:8-oxo-dGTP pyrophosphatase MutT (NUDIX family)
MPSYRSTRFLSTEVLVENKWHRYCRDRFRQTDGSEGEYYHIDMAGACGTIPLFRDGSTVLLQVYRYVLDATLWEFPIGGMAPGDDPLDVAKRELEEEAGLVANHWTLLGQFAPYKGVSNEIDRFYLAKDLTWTEQKLEPSEEIQVHRMPLDEARRRLYDQPLIDGQSIVGLHLLDQSTRR